MSGYLLRLRKTSQNVRMIEYRAWKSGRPTLAGATYAKTGAVVVWSKHVLRKLAEESPLFAPIWNAVRHLPPDWPWIYLADAPDAKWLKSIAADERRLYDEHGTGGEEYRKGLGPEPAEEKLRERCLQACRWMESEEYGRAEASLESLVKQHPGLLMGWKALARCALRQGAHAKAQALLERLKRDYPDCLEFDRFGADLSMEMKDWKGAEPYLVRLSNLNPWDPVVMKKMARVAAELQRHEQAATIYEECAEHGPLGFGDVGVLLSTLAKARRFGEVPRTLARHLPPAIAASCLPHVRACRHFADRGKRFLSRTVIRQD